MIRLGMIGCGGRGQGLIDLMDRLGLGARVVAIADPRSEQLQKDLVGRPWLAEDACFFTDADEMLNRSSLDGVVVATRCSLHTTMALKVLERDLPLYLEKPVATSVEDWGRLRAAGEKRKSPVVVSFPLRVSPLVQTTKRIIDSGQLGTIEYALGWCYPSYGGNYYHDWYRDEHETGGLFLQKATHDFDYLNYVIARPARSLCAMASKRVFTGAKPAGLQCDACEDQESCPESGFNLYYLRGERDRVKPSGRYCGFAVDTGNEDSSSAIIEYGDGMHVVYTQCFYARKGAGSRGARFIGYKGTVEFDWSTNEVTVYMHHEPRVERYEHKPAGGHGGGDTVLAYNFIQLVRGDAGVTSVAPLQAGLQSVYMCLMARASALDRQFKDLAWP